MRIIREPLCKDNGRRQIVAKYSSITTQAAHDFMLGFAQKEAESRKDIKSISLQGGSLSGQSTATMMDIKSRSVVRYFQEW